MAKWSGKVGYVKSGEVERGVWSDNIVTEKTQYGDMISNRINNQPSTDSTNSNISLNNNISIVADSFAMENFGYIKYVVVKGVKWKVVNIQIQHPRLVLTIGGLYNGK